MRNRASRYLLIFLALVFALSSADYIHAESDLTVQAINNSSPDPTTVPVKTSTPLPDGTVKHIVAEGQILYTIAEIYMVSVESLLELNDLETDAILNIGDELIIFPSYTPTSTPIGEPSSTPPPRYSHTPSQGTPKGISFSSATPVPTETILPEPRFRDNVKNPVIIIAAVVISGGSLAAALYFSLRKR